MVRLHSWIWTLPARSAAKALPWSQSPLHQLSNRTQVEIQVLNGNAELRGDVADRFLELHERAPDVFRLVVGQRAGFHAADRLSLEELADELDERQHQLRDRPLHIVGIRIPSGRRAHRRALELAAQFFELCNLGHGHAALRQGFRLRRGYGGQDDGQARFRHDTWLVAGAGRLAFAGWGLRHALTFQLPISNDELPTTNHLPTGERIRRPRSADDAVRSGRRGGPAGGNPI